MSKQYFTKPSYADNYKVVQVVDGKIEDWTIVAGYEWVGYCSALENMGYEKALYVREAELEVEEAKAALALAEAELERAKKMPLEICDEDAKKHFAKCFESSEESY